jgi:hypothetical protein
VALLTAGIVGAVLQACGGGGGGGGDGGGGGGGGGGTGVRLSADVQPIFNNHCVLCHTTGGSASFLNLTSGSAHANLVNVASTETVGGGLRVAPGNSSTSVLYKRVSGVGLDASEAIMPPGFFLSAAEQQTIKDWIDQGGLNN